MTKRRWIVEILGLQYGGDDVFQERARIRATWRREAKNKATGVKPEYGTLVHLKDLERTFYLTDEQVKQFIEQRHVQQVWDGKRFSRDQLSKRSVVRKIGVSFTEK